MIPKASYDVIVVGAGPAGSTAAFYAARNGASVLLLDKKREIGSPIQCAGFLPDASEVRALLPDAKLPDTLKSILIPACSSRSKPSVSFLQIAV